MDLQSIFLKLLDEPQIREKICSIVQKPLPAEIEGTAACGGTEPETTIIQPSEEEDRELAEVRKRVTELEHSLKKENAKSAQQKAEIEKQSAEIATYKARITDQETQLFKQRGELERMTAEHNAKAVEFSQKKEELRLLAQERDDLQIELTKSRGELNRRTQEKYTAEQEANAQRQVAERALAKLTETETALRQVQAAYRADMAPFAELKTHYRAYMSLPESRRTDLSKIIACCDPAAFLTSGSQRDTSFSLWDYMKSRLDELTGTEHEILARTLQYFLNRYNSLWTQPIYEWMDGETGKVFDDQRHSRSSTCSRYQGNIEQVLLPGIWNRNKKSAERKCIVHY